LKPKHILAKPGEVAERAVVSGDPRRVELLASKLDDARLVSNNRGLLVYTGRYGDSRVTVATHGIGGPSAAIVFEELVMLGARAIVRLGTCGGLVESLRPGDIVIPNGAGYWEGGLYAQYLGGGACMCAVPNYELLEGIVREAKALGLEFTVGPVVSNDAFYAESPDFAKEWGRRGALAVEMECAILFLVGLLKGVKTAAILVVVNNVLQQGDFATPELVRPQFEKAFEVALKALVKCRI